MKRKNLITIGTFDGVHCGHRHLFNRLDTMAAQHLLKPLVLYFPFPPKYISNQPEMSILTPPAEKGRLLFDAGMQTVALDFNEVQNLTPEEFFKKLQKKYNMGGLLVGADFAFGKDRQGGIDFLRDQCARLKIPFEVVDFYKVGTQKVSSSLVRNTLAKGNIKEANALLGWNYKLTGRVVKGDKLGRKIGFPTANLDTGVYKILPLGVFAVRVRVGRKHYNGFCNIGFRPTVNKQNPQTPLVEVHIFDFHQSIYGRDITIWFEDKLRNEQKFAGLDALKAQLTKDQKAAQALFAKLDKQKAQ